eukprot:CAMPEP_0179174414 /NCGR_PEP_ID=MMETSP0796-20121207/86110_1 /TAXON_ID=73915 /ORGANISM="Pyrodinium bahamense, Strain pbaha01" /LENGTH=611 /DNA_ID=CAMNT_0020877709 /DNA_START=18 /DNA_END=1853 /DNA_ORIENTATION=+
MSGEILQTLEDRVASLEKKVGSSDLFTCADNLGIIPGCIRMYRNDGLVFRKLSARLLDFEAQLVARLSGMQRELDEKLSHLNKAMPCTVTKELGQLKCDVTELRGLLSMDQGEVNHMRRIVQACERSMEEMRAQLDTILPLNATQRHAEGARPTGLAGVDAEGAPHLTVMTAGASAVHGETPILAMRSGTLEKSPEQPPRAVTPGPGREPLRELLVEPQGLREELQISGLAAVVMQGPAIDTTAEEVASSTYEPQAAARRLSEQLLNTGERFLSRTSSDPVIGDSSMSTGSLSARSTLSLPIEAEIGARTPEEQLTNEHHQATKVAPEAMCAKAQTSATASCRRVKTSLSRQATAERDARATELAESFRAWRARRPDLGQLLALAEICFGSSGRRSDHCRCLGEHPEVLSGLDEVSRHTFSLVHFKSTSGTNRQPFVNTVLDAAQMAALRRIMPESFCEAGGAFEFARQQITLLVLVVIAQDSSNASSLLAAPRSRNVLEGLRRALLAVTDGSPCSANTLRLVMNFLSEFRVSLIKVLASGLMRGRGSHSRFHQHAMSAQRACMAFLCGNSPGEGDIERRMAILHRLAQAQPAALARKLEGVLQEITAPLD